MDEVIRKVAALGLPGVLLAMAIALLSPLKIKDRSPLYI